MADKLLFVMDSEDSLRALSERCGIAAQYHNIWGELHATSTETRRALLAAMHLPIDTTDPATLLERLEDDEWRHLLPPVRVVRRGEVIRIKITLPVDGCGKSCKWTLRLEGGEAYSGEFVAVESPQLGERQVHDLTYRRVALELPPLDETGYHRFELHLSGGDEHLAMPLIVVPAACYQPDAIRGEGRVWGPAVQLYGLRSRRNWGIGDFTDLRNLVDLTADAGGGIVGVNPLHALFPHEPARISPYSPSSRAFVNVLYIDVEAIPEFGDCEAARALVASDGFQARLRRQRAANLVDYPAVAAAKREVLDLVYAHFVEHHLGKGSERAKSFSDFRAAGGEALEQLGRFEALQAHFFAADPSVWGWPAWPEPYRDPDAPAVAEFAATHADAVRFHVWLQWLADEQLAEVGRRAWRRGLGVGLYADLAVGANPGGAETWRWQRVFANAHVGAPPDDFSLLGQDWGVPPFAPRLLRDAAYAPLTELLRLAMRHAGALRIDHVMGLLRLFWVPPGNSAKEGAYVAYPIEDMLGIVALESERNRCLVIGEDLGTVPDGLRERLAANGFLSYHPFLFERVAGGAFKPPAEYKRQALACASTHDLPTLAGLWKGSDLDARTALGLFPSEQQREALLAARSQDRAHLLAALEREHLLPDGTGVDPVSVPEFSPPLARAVHAYLARTPAQVLVVQPEDIFGVADQANLPGTRDDQHPNWSRRLPLDLEDWRADARFIQTAEMLLRGRGGSN